MNRAANGDCSRCSRWHFVWQATFMMLISKSWLYLVALQFKWRSEAASWSWSSNELMLNKHTQEDLAAASKSAGFHLIQLDQIKLEQSSSKETFKSVCFACRMPTTTTTTTTKGVLFYIGSRADDPHLRVMMFITSSKVRQIIFIITDSDCWTSDE